MQLPFAKEYGIVLLAAGTSSRLGKPKQLLIFEGNTLVKKMAEVALKVTDKLVVVTGAHGEKISEELKELPAHIIPNDFFGEGIASSIRTGLQELLRAFETVQSVIFLVSDQPFVTSELLNSLIEKKEQTGKGIIASHYEGTLGTPVLLHQNFFQELLTLKGDAGAKKLIYQYPNEVVSVDFPDGAIDIDTVEDYQALLLTTHRNKI